MRFNSLIMPVVAALALSAAACGDDGGGGSLTASSFVTQFGDAFCGKAFECKDSFPTGQGVTHDQIFGADEAACKAMLITGAQLQASVDAGRVTFNGSAAGSCISSMNAFACPAWWDAIFMDMLRTTCDMATVGTVAVGGTCTIGADCAGTSSCSSGTCQAPAANGAAPAKFASELLQ